MPALDWVGAPVSELRRLYAESRASLLVDYPEDVDGFTLAEPGLSGLRFVPAGGGQGAPVLYFHGGGWVVGSPETHRVLCAWLAKLSGREVYSVAYRLAPEHAFPAQPQDAIAALSALLKRFDQVFVAGDSAGGNLAASVAHHARGRLTGIVGQVLIYPGLGGPHDQGSYLTHANAPMLTAQDIAFYRMVRVAGEEPQGDPTYAPLHDSDFTGLPPTLIVTAECDPLCDDGGLYRDQIVAAGGQAHWITEPGLVHGYLRARSTGTRARDSFARIKNGIEALTQGLWPYG